MAIREAIRPASDYLRPGQDSQAHWIFSERTQTAHLAFVLPREQYAATEEAIKNYLSDAFHLHDVGEVTRLEKGGFALVQTMLPGYASGGDIPYQLHLTLDDARMVEAYHAPFFQESGKEAGALARLLKRTCGGKGR